MAQPTWRAIALLAVTIDAAWEEPGGTFRRGRRRRLERTMSQPEIDATVDVLERVPAAVDRWSEGSVGMDLQAVVALTDPVRRLTPIGDGRWWVAAEDVPAEAWRLV